MTKEVFVLPREEVIKEYGSTPCKITVKDPTNNTHKEFSYDTITAGLLALVAFSKNWCLLTASVIHNGDACLLSASNRDNSKFSVHPYPQPTRHKHAKPKHTNLFDDI